MAERGAVLALAGRDRERLARTAGPLGGEALPGDLTDPVDRERIADRCRGTLLPDVVVHNAGAGLAGAAHLVDDHAMADLLALNVVAPAALTRLLLPDMVARNSGHLVFVTSIAAHLGVAGEAAYAASKAALSGYAASLRDELAGTAIRVTTFAPGVVDTEFFSRRGVDYRRRIPRPAPAPRVAEALVRSVEGDRAEVVVPRWLRLPIVLRAALPGAYARLSGRFG